MARALCRHHDPEVQQRCIDVASGQDEVHACVEYFLRRNRLLKKLSLAGGPGTYESNDEGDVDLIEHGESVDVVNGLLSAVADNPTVELETLYCFPAMPDPKVLGKLLAGQLFHLRDLSLTDEKHVAEGSHRLWRLYAGQ